MVKCTIKLGWCNCHCHGISPTLFHGAAPAAVVAAPAAAVVHQTAVRGELKSGFTTCSFYLFNVGDHDLYTFRGRWWLHCNGLNEWQPHPHPAEPTHPALKSVQNFESCLSCGFFLNWKTGKDKNHYGINPSNNCALSFKKRKSSKSWNSSRFFLLFLDMG